MPSIKRDGGTSPAKVNNVTGGRSAWAASLTWKETVGGVGVNSQIAYYTEDTTNTVDGGKGRSAIHGGLRLAYQGFDVGYAFGRFLQSEAGTGVPSATTIDGHTHGAAVSYKSGPWKVGAWLLNHQNEGQTSVAGDDETRVYSVFGQYDLSAGVLLQGMIFNVDYDEENNVDANEQSGGWGIVAGMKLSF